MIDYEKLNKKLLEFYECEKAYWLKTSLPSEKYWDESEHYDLIEEIASEIEEIKKHD